MALKQRFAQIEATKRKLDQADRALRMRQVEKDIQRENKWYRLTHISIGIGIGVALTLFGLSFKDNLSNPAPVVQVEGK
ncbi:hypothetical protein HRE53_32715 (plasmid) [Acaryochloris sp. 'Moss Beach']|uniref:hypothetical protein n=1 Tax=Acaryochloris TaxID=155977 RepID=UPI001BAEDC22|nr:MULTISPECIES: hypothetical protein [Acaryochloris]QUY45827.1 hypothetical protein I1H34_29235 [Acaryochloris marina S15]UJB73398.1 hypothetical protein HRE53_32715 [Acaryochloris sp. 'Moss Beach']